MERRNRMLFRLIAACTFVSALLYECLTPLLSDDLNYLSEVAQASGIADVLHQEVVQYCGWTGRSVAHIILRLFFYVFHGRSAVFNITAALVFLALTLLMLRLIRRDGKGVDDWKLYLLLVLGFWLFAVKPGHTVFWMTGACNYLFTTTIILGFFALCERFFAGKEHTALRAALLFPAGVLAGWCNENTSGAAVLNVLLLLLLPLWERASVRGSESGGTAEAAADRNQPDAKPCLMEEGKRDSADRESFAGSLGSSWFPEQRQESLRAADPARTASPDQTKASLHTFLPGLAALLGVCAGFAMQLLSPGNRSRSALIEESHTGLLLYGARFLQILHELWSLFLPLMLAALLLLLLARHQGTGWNHRGMKNALRYLLLWAAASFALLLAPSPQTRTYFGAGVFLLIACAQLFALVRWEGAPLKALRDFAVYALLIVFVFRYFEEGGNLARICREENRRYLLLEEAQAAGVEDAYIPILPEGFDSPYSMAYETDVHKEWYMFPNMQLGNYYRIDTVSGIPYDAYSEVAP